MSETTGMGGLLLVDPQLRGFVDSELLAGLDLEPTSFWSTVARLHERFAGRVEELLRRRDELQERIDGWHREHGPGDLRALETFLTEIGYLLPLEQPVVSVTGVDPEISTVAGPQLVVPATVPRYALNAANARWGSLYDALYGTDALPLDHELERGYDVRRGAQVIAEADRLLDLYFPLVDASHADVTAYQVDSPGRLTVQTAQGATGLVDPAQFVAHRRVPAGDALGGGAPAPARAARGAGHRQVDAGGTAAPRGGVRRRGGVGGHDDRGPGGLGCHGRRAGQGRRLPHLARASNGRADRHVRQGRARADAPSQWRPHLRRHRRWAP